MNEINIFLPAGTLLHAGQYRIEQHLASGGFGNTYLAIDVNLKAKVAIKEFYIKTINHREDDSRTVSVSNTANLEMFHSLREKFKKEAQRIFQIQHNNVVRVFSLFEEFGTVYYAMDFIDGESLNSRLKRDGVLPESLVRSVFTQMLDALDVVHSAGLLHLDIKPHNIMLTTDGVAKLIDFGASKHSNQADATTTTGFAFTPEYAPPELTNQEYDEIGPWTDIYSLGITLYRLLSNAPIPSKREIRMNGAAAFTYSQPVSAAMQHLIVRMTQGASERRPQSIVELRALAGQLNGQIVLEPQVAEKTVAVSKPVQKVAISPEMESQVAAENTVAVAYNSDVEIPHLETDKRRKNKWILLACLAFAILTGIAVWLTTRPSSSNGEISEESTPVITANGEENKKAGEKYIAELMQKDHGYKKLPSGVAYKVLKAGKGQTIQDSWTVNLIYVGKHIDGREFDSSVGQAVLFNVKMTLPGFRDVLTQMKPGAQGIAIIPGDQAYGEMGNPAGGIAPNETLVLEFTITDVAAK